MSKSKGNIMLNLLKKWFKSPKPAVDPDVYAVPLIRREKPNLLVLFGDGFIVNWDEIKNETEVLVAEHDALYLDGKLYWGQMTLVEDEPYIYFLPTASSKSRSVNGINFPDPEWKQYKNTFDDASLVAGWNYEANGINTVEKLASLEDKIVELSVKLGGSDYIITTDEIIKFLQRGRNFFPETLLSYTVPSAKLFKYKGCLRSKWRVYNGGLQDTLLIGKSKAFPYDSRLTPFKMDLPPEHAARLKINNFTYTDS